MRCWRSWRSRGEVVALSLSVDYWDYLGWRDTLANSKFTERQRAYAKARGDGAIYTPQIIVNGIAHVNGSDEGQILQAIDKTSKGGRDSSACPFASLRTRAS